MIETEQVVVIDAPIGQVWEYARDIRAWAKLMPGLQECDVVDDDRSRWTLKVGAGALVRKVKVSVQVERWAGPEQVDFTYRLDGDPVKGGGTYRATASGLHATEVTFCIRVEGTGPMAPMWEAMGRPLLPKFARGFAEQFKAEIEKFASVTPVVPETLAPPRPPGIFTRLVDWIRKLLAALPMRRIEGSRK